MFYSTKILQEVYFLYLDSTYDVKVYNDLFSHSGVIPAVALNVSVGFDCIASDLPIAKPRA